MIQQPSLFKIAQNDSWVTPTIGSFIFLVAITAIVQIVNWITGVELSDIKQYILITGVFFLIALIFIPLRVRYVRDIFENGVEVKAQVVSTKIYRANLKLTLLYGFQGQSVEKSIDQVITRQTKHYIHEKEVTLVLNQNHPNRILLRDAYLS